MSIISSQLFFFKSLRNLQKSFEHKRQFFWMPRMHTIKPFFFSTNAWNSTRDQIEVLHSLV